MRYLGESVERAAQGAVDDLYRDGGMGGVIALDNVGNGECASFLFPPRSRVAG
jgi:beta-aspartyl-peptidase (threonine type)